MLDLGWTQHGPSNILPPHPIASSPTFLVDVPHSLSRSQSVPTGYWELTAGCRTIKTSPITSASPKTPPSPTQSESQLLLLPQGHSEKFLRLPPRLPTFFLFSPARTQRYLYGPFAPGAELSSKTLVVSHDGKLLFSGGHWDNSLRVTSLSKGKVVGHINRHIGRNSCFCQLFPGKSNLWNLGVDGQMRTVSRSSLNDFYYPDLFQVVLEVQL